MKREVGVDVLYEIGFRRDDVRQAVDLANMMLSLALRSTPECVYQRALRQFSVEEISEAFAERYYGVKPEA